MSNTPMSNQEILEKAIQKAIDGGWNKLNQMIPYGYRNYIEDQRVVKLSANDDGMVGSEYFNVEAIIFNHDFAKALWSEAPEAIGKVYGNTLYSKSDWRYHLQQMVIADDPLEYLGEHL